MPIDVMCPECDTVDVLRVDMDFVKDGKVHEHWECEKCGHEWVDETPVDDYDKCPNSEMGQPQCKDCTYIHDSGLWGDCPELQEVNKYSDEQIKYHRERWDSQGVHLSRAETIERMESAGIEPEEPNADGEAEDSGEVGNMRKIIKRAIKEIDRNLSAKDIDEPETGETALELVRIILTEEGEDSNMNKLREIILKEELNKMTTTREDQLISMLVYNIKELITECGYEKSHIISICEEVIVEDE